MIATTFYRLFKILRVATRKQASPSLSGYFALFISEREISCHPGNRRLHAK